MDNSVALPLDPTATPATFRRRRPTAIHVASAKPQVFACQPVCIGAVFEQSEEKMVYALLNQNTLERDRARILRAIQSDRSENIRDYVRRDVIIHITDVQNVDEDLFCIYCLDQIDPSRTNGPAGEVVDRHWYFRHRTNRQCIGRETLIGGVVFTNRRRHGCYAAMGCLISHPVQNCFLRRRDPCYCHHAFSRVCPPQR
jgi:hypothetical protein